MNRRDFNKVLSAAALAPAGISGAAVAATSWSLEANVAECCSCEIPCPCNFGKPTSLRCDGNRLIEIVNGHINDVDLAGVRFLVTFEMGRWTRIYADEAMTGAERAAYRAIMPLAYAGFRSLALSEEFVPLKVERTDEQIAFATPASEVIMKPLAGLDGARITVSGLPSNVFHDYVQYESVRHVHNGPEIQWLHSGTNGFTSRMLASG